MLIIHREILRNNPVSSKTLERTTPDVNRYRIVFVHADSASVGVATPVTMYPQARKIVKITTDARSNAASKMNISVTHMNRRMSAVTPGPRGITSSKSGITIETAH